MAERTWLAIILGCLVWFGYVKWFVPPPPPGITKEANEPVTQPVKPATGNVDPPASGAGLTQPLQMGDVDKWVQEDMTVTFTAHGGTIGRVELPKYHETLKKNAPPLPLVSTETGGQSLNTLFTNPELSTLSHAVFHKSVTPGEMTFKAISKDVEYQKSYRHTSPYVLRARYDLKVKPGKDWGYVLIPVGGRDLKFDSHEPLKGWEVVYYQNDSTTRTHTDSLKEGEQVHQGNTKWLSFGNRYFATAVINRSELNPDVVLVNQNHFVGGYLRYPIVVKEGRNNFSIEVEYFLGPKDYTELSKIQGLKSLIDYGMFSVLAYPLLQILRFFYQYVHNYGIAILLLTLLVRTLFYPLQLKSVRSMKNMQKLQPQIAAIKEKYKDDMKKANEEQMALFKAHKVNPMGGCLPMLVQLPVFIALYAVLGNSIELFQAPFFGWIHDLSAKDPFYIFPVLMGISFFVQQKMTPNVGMDPVQQKMMMIMPVMFTFLMISLPAGLTGYIFFSTLLGILQQVFINREKTATPLNAQQQS